MSTDQNQYTDANGVRYVAQDDVRICDGCAFDVDGEPCLDLPKGDAPCSANVRADSRSIIWIAVK